MEKTTETTKTKLYCEDFKGESVGTTCSFGSVKFDRHGVVEVEATDDDLVKLNALKWTEAPPERVLTAEEKIDAATPREDIVLYAPDYKGETVGTPMGPVQFDAKGYAPFHATAEQIAKFRRLGWMLNPTPSVETMEKARAGQPVAGPTIEEWVDAGYFPENYPPSGYESIESAGLKQYKETGKGPWSEAVLQSRRDQYKKQDAEAVEREAAQAAADKAKAEIAERDIPKVVETPAPTPVAEDAVPAPSEKHDKKKHR